MDAALRQPATDEHRSAESTAFDASKYSHIIDWTHSSFIIRGRPVSIVSAEFQYFRVPDRERWLPILTDIKSMGFNTVRIYIHWGYHSPAENAEYNFRGNRDIDYLLSLCVQLQLFVIVAPGPYICAEVQAGGFPIWLIAKRHIRVRHLTCPPLGFLKKWDQRFHDYCAKYMHDVVSMLAKWELTTNPNGCIIAMQIENELREKPTIGFGGIDDEIRLLCEVARRAGSTVPFFHNDDSPLGSWSAGGDYRSLAKAGLKTGQKAYRTDMYGFDLYFTFPPGDRSGDLSSMQVGMLEACGVSACLNCCGIGGPGVGGSDTPYLSCLYENDDVRHTPPPSLAWADAKQMESAVDVLGDLMHKFNGSARLAPPIVAEAQVGWINQWGRFRTYDDVYSFFGDDFSAALQNSLMAQGLTIINHYIAYGGTNHGTVGDTEVYSSYDYSAFIREFGLLSRRGRVLRQSILFARSFTDVGLSNNLLSEESNTKVSNALVAVKSTVPSVLIAVRDAVALDIHGMPINRTTKFRTYAFLRNLREDLVRFSLVVQNVVLPCRLIKCESFVAPLYHDIDQCDLSIFASTIPVVCRTTYAGCELWVLHVRSDEVGRLVLKRDDSSDGVKSAIKVQWAKVGDDSEDIQLFEKVVSHSDDGAAISLFSSPLEELPLSNHGSLSDDGASLGVKASTEEVGQCFSFSFSPETTAAVVYNLDEQGSKTAVLRILCLTSKDVDTFNANLAGTDRFSELSANYFTAAWGSSNLAVLPNGNLDVGMTPQDDGSNIFVIQDADSGPPEQFKRCNSSVVSVLPGLWVHKIQRDVVRTLLSNGMDGEDMLSKDFKIPIEKLSMRKVDWNDNVMWKEISYEDRDPLDHFMTSGHITYRFKFRCAKPTGSIILNIRHSAVIWCNGKAIGSQICFSHNVMSAGAMHGIDLANSGKRRHSLNSGLQNGPDADGFHEVIILVLSMGQSRSPFLLNDVRNKRGLLSARFSKRMGVKDVKLEIAGKDVTDTDDAYGWSGLPIEEEANTMNYESGFEPIDKMGQVIADDGVVFYRGKFKVPANSVVGGSVRYPLRIKVKSGAGVRAFIWVNTLFMGRYVEQLGPQTDFYVPEGLIKECKGNSIVIAVYGHIDSAINIEILPWVVNPSTGNCDQDNGVVYALRKVQFRLSNLKN